MYATLTAQQASQVTPISGEKQQEYENYSSDEDIEPISLKPKSLTDFQVPAEYGTDNWAVLIDRDESHCFGCGYEHDPNEPCPIAGDKCEVCGGDHKAKDCPCHRPDSSIMPDLSAFCDTDWQRNKSKTQTATQASTSQSGTGKKSGKTSETRNTSESVSGIGSKFYL